MLPPSQRRRLRQAREYGFLNAVCRDNASLVKEYGLWCWRMRIPMVWFERRSPRSRFGRLRVDLLTTPHMLTSAGQEAVRILGGRATAHDVIWERASLLGLDRLAHAIFRIVVNPRHYRRNRSPVAAIEIRRAKALTLVPRRIASA